MTKARRKAAPSKELVPIKHPDWDRQVKDVLELVHRYTRTGPNGYQTPPETRRLLAADAASRLHNLTDQLDAKLRSGSSWPAPTWAVVDDESGF